MRRAAAAIFACALLAACGADGEPEQPPTSDGTPGVRVTGDAQIGMSVGESGARGYGSVGLTNGPVTFRLGL